MTLEQRVEYLELRDKNTRTLIESQQKLIDLLARTLELTLLAPEKAAKVQTAKYDAGFKVSII